MFKQSFASRCGDGFGVSPGNVGWCWIYYAVKVNVQSLIFNPQEQESIWPRAVLCGAILSPVGAWGVRGVSYQTFLQMLSLKGSQAQPGVLAQLVSTSKKPLGWEEEEDGEQGDVAEEDKAVERRICGKLMGVELALCPSKFSFPWLCAGSPPPQSREGAGCTHS